jgi:hypothetical protein
VKTDLNKVRKSFERLTGIALSSERPYIKRAFHFRPGARLRRMLREGPSRVMLTRATKSTRECSLEKLFRDSSGGFKWQHYFDVYEEVLRSSRGKPTRILEIGVFEGGSARMWMGYFGVGSTYVGVDINPACTIHEDMDRNINIRIGDQTDGQFLQSVAAEFGPFDVIIDDGSHISSHVIRSFELLFPDHLREGGIYLVEDLHAAYWTEFRDQDYSFLDFTRSLIDILHQPYIDHPSSWSFRMDNERRLRELDVNFYCSAIREIRIFDSIVAIQKSGAKALPALELRR